MRPVGWLFLALHCAALYGCILILARHYGLDLPSGGGWTATFFYLAAPWITPLTSFIAWRKTRQWRRIKAMATPAPSLSRGGSHPALPDNRPSTLERLSALSLLIAIAAIAHRRV